MSILDMNYMLMGKLIVKWANEPNSRPADISGLKAQCRDNGFELILHEGTSNVVFEDLPKMPANTVRFVVPHKDDINQPLDGADGYPAPRFYDGLYVPPVERRTNMSAEAVENFRLARIGDYTTAKCG